MLAERRAAEPVLPLHLFRNANFSNAIHSVFIWSAPIALAIFVLGWFITEVPLRERAPEPASVGDDTSAGRCRYPHWPGW